MRSIITKAEQKALAVARKGRTTKTVSVQAHDRTMAFGMLPKYRQMARWERANMLIGMIASDSDAFGVTEDDRKHALKLILLLDDTFIKSNR